MKTTYTTYRVGENPVETEVDLPEEPSLPQLMEILAPVFGDAWFEHVWISPLEGQRHSMFVNESGHLNNLPRNEKATELYRANAMRNGKCADDLPYIVGPAVVFDRCVWF